MHMRGHLCLHEDFGVRGIGTQCHQVQHHAVVFLVTEQDLLVRGKANMVGLFHVRNIVNPAPVSNRRLKESDVLADFRRSFSVLAGKVVEKILFCHAGRWRFEGNGGASGVGRWRFEGNGGASGVGRWRFEGTAVLRGLADGASGERR